jgi:hypothetical protein
MQLAGFYNSQGDFDKTIQALRDRIAVEPNNPEAYQTLATYYWDAAYRDFRLADKTKMEYVLQGLDAVDRAISIKNDYMEAVAYSSPPGQPREGPGQAAGTAPPGRPAPRQGERAIRAARVRRQPGRGPGVTPGVGFDLNTVVSGECNG